jgi:hypothetical protein
MKFDFGELNLVKIGGGHVNLSRFFQIDFCFVSTNFAFKKFIYFYLERTAINENRVDHILQNFHHSLLLQNLHK